MGVGNVSESQDQGGRELKLPPPGRTRSLMQRGISDPGTTVIGDANFVAYDASRSDLWIVLDESLCLFRITGSAWR